MVCHAKIRTSISTYFCFFKVVVQFNCVHESLDNVALKNKELSNFIRKYDLFTPLELPEVLKVDEIMLYDLMSRVVPCVGCRRR